MAGDFYERYWSLRKGRKLCDFDYKWPKLSLFIPSDEDMTILDFGCGDGEIIGEMKKINPGASFIGLDVARTALDLACEHYPEVQFFRVTDGGRFPIDDGSIDFIFSSEVIEHVYDTGNAFSEIARVLKVGGKLLITAPYHGLVKNLLLALFAFDRHFDPTDAHIRFFTRRSLSSCLRKVGLEPVESHRMGYVYPLSRTLVVLAEKKN